MRPGVRTAAAAALVTLTLFSLVSLREVWKAEGNYSVLLRVSDRALRSNPLLRDRIAVREHLVVAPSGYDGQFSYFAAFDPLLTRYAHAPDNYFLMMDMAPYRYGRIGHVWLTRLIAGDRWRSYPATLVWTVLLGCFWSALALSAMAMHAGRSPWWGATVLLVPGFWQSVQLALPEPLAAAAVLTGAACVQRRVWWGAALAFALALLTRETSVIAIACVCGGLWFGGNRRAALVVFICALTPVALWRWHVYAVLSPVFGWDAAAFNPGTFGAPFSGMFAAADKVASGTYHPAAPEIGRSAIGLAILVSGAALTAWLAAWTRPSWATLTAAAYAVMAVSLSAENVWNHPGNAQRTSAELFLWLTVVAATWRTPGGTARRCTIAGLTAAAVFILLLAYDASKIRGALMPWTVAPVEPWTKRARPPVRQHQGRWTRLTAPSATRASS